jgi:hypothetical protein
MLVRTRQSYKYLFTEEGRNLPFKRLKPPPAQFRRARSNKLIFLLLIKNSFQVKKILIALAAASALVISSCSTDLDVTGDWKETMVVYGLLDQGKDTQYIKVNKAFLGQGNALEYAQVKDSVQFVNTLAVTVTKATGSVTYDLLPINKPKEDGVFYSADQANALYYFVTPPGTLSANSRYDLKIRNEDTGNEVTSSTLLVNDFSFTKPTSTSPNFYFVNSLNDNWPFFVEWKSSQNGRIYQLVIRFNYTEYSATDTVNKYIDWFFPAQKAPNSGGNHTMTVSFPGVDLLKYLGTRIPVDNAVTRQAGLVELRVTGGSDDLNTFIEVNKPSSGLVQQKPEFTNISNGLGLFSSRYTKAPFARPLEAVTLDSLAGGRYTCKLRFTDAAGVLSGCL